MLHQCQAVGGNAAAAPALGCGDIRSHCVDDRLRGAPQLPHQCQAVRSPPAAAPVLGCRSTCSGHTSGRIQQPQQRPAEAATRCPRPCQPTTRNPHQPMAQEDQGAPPSHRMLSGRRQPSPHQLSAPVAGANTAATAGAKNRIKREKPNKEREKKQKNNKKK